MQSCNSSGAIVVAMLVLACGVPAAPVHAQAVQLRSEAHESQGNSDQGGVAWEVFDPQNERVVGVMSLGRQAAPPGDMLISAFSLLFMEYYELTLASLDNSGITVTAISRKLSPAAGENVRAATKAPPLSEARSMSIEKRVPLVLLTARLSSDLHGATTATDTFRLPMPVARLKAPPSMLGFPLLDFVLRSSDGAIDVFLKR